MIMRTVDLDEIKSMLVNERWKIPKVVNRSGNSGSVVPLEDVVKAEPRNCVQRIGADICMNASVRFFGRHPIGKCYGVASI
jgi:hypothetical protein